MLQPTIPTRRQPHPVGTDLPTGPSGASAEMITPPLSTWSGTRHHGQQSLWQAGTLKRLIHDSHREQGRLDQEDWINTALVEDSFELVMAHDHRGHPVAGVDVVRDASGRLALTQRAVLPRFHGSPAFAGLIRQILDAHLDPDTDHAVVVKGDAIETALDAQGWQVSGYAGDGRHVWHLPVEHP
ncbi:hypothetical protein KEM60_00130 [Austwickia sp. TVS 96-490-7B]|nr:hypothetical protein [Austwickia sp. TVS 96-490-7B]